MTTVRSRRKYIVRQFGAAASHCPHQLAGLVLRLGRRHEGAVDPAATVAEGVVEVPRDDLPTAGGALLAEVEVLLQRVDMLDIAVTAA